MISKFTSVLRTGIAASLMLIATLTSKAQLQVAEGFNQPTGNSIAPLWPAGNLPFGWTMGIGADANASWDRMNNPGVLPACVPFGTAMVRARTAYCVTANDPMYLISKPYDLSTRGAAASNCNFWIYRDANAGVDNIQVYANTAPVAAGAPLTDTATFLNTIQRCFNAAPVVGAAGWYKYGFIIPAALSVPQVYIILKVTHVPAATTSNVYIDDFEITTYPNTQIFNTITLDYQNTNIVGKPSNNNDIIGIRVNTTGSGPGNVGLTVGNFQFLPNGSTMANPFPTDVSNTRLWWTGGSGQFNPLTATQIGTFAGAMSPNWNISGAGLGGLDNGDNWFWLTYDIPAGATSNDCVDADFVSAVLGGTLRTCGVVGCTYAGCRLIDIPPPCVPTYTAGDSWLNGSYTDNDYVKWVQCPGDPAYPPGINNDHNEVNGALFPVGAGYGTGANKDPCVPTSTYIQNGTVSPFSNHPPDYQKFTTSTSPAMPACVGAPYNHPTPSSRTAVFLETSVSPPVYNINVQCGTWFGANCIAAWIDFNHDGVFNNAFAPAGEKILQSGYMNLLTYVNANFSVPVTGYYGPTTMRVREWYANNNMDPCSPGYYGEVEDYTVTLRPDCSPLYPGWKIWLGYTDDWNVNSNWCGGVPTINDNALIPGKGAAGFNRGAGTYHPVIKSVGGLPYLATTRKLVMLNDTVEINSPVAGSLRISDSLSIGTVNIQNTSALIVDSSYSNTATVLNGGFTDNTYSPLRASLKEQKMQMMFQTSEILGQGLADGDVIDEIWIPIRTHGSSAATAYPMQVNMFYSDNTNPNYPTFMTTGFAGVVPGAGQATAAISGVAPTQPPAVGAYPVNVYSGNLNLSSAGQLGVAPPGLGTGMVKLILQKPFYFYATGNYPLMVEVCYEMVATSTNDQVWQNQTASYRSVLLLAHNTNALGPACGWTAATGLIQKLSSTLRPNLIFKYHRVYQKFPINMETNGATTAQWANYGNFVPANSIVTFMGTSLAQQHIDGTNNTTYDELKINNNTGYVQQNRPATVNDTLWLQNGRLYLNGLTLTVNNGLTGAITQIAPNGYLYSESLPPNYGLVKWKIGANTGTYTFPFLSPNGPTPIPFSYQWNSGVINDLTVGTYYPSTTPPSMIPYPTGVTTVNSYNNPAVTDAPNMVRRFWTITQAGGGAPNANLTFTWSGTAAETPTNGTGGGLMSQRWQGGAITWDFPTPAQASGVNTVSAPNITIFNTPWALTRQPEPLPIKLLNFTAKAEKTKVRLDWVTASEINNDYFTVDRTQNTNDFTFIDKVQSRGPSTNTQNYFTYDNSPLMGRQFYRLKQTDINGRFIYSDLVPVDFGSSTSLGDQFEITQVMNYDNGSTDVIFKYNSELPLTYRLVDKLGRLVINKSISKPINGLNIITLDGNLASGIYTLMIQSQSETITRKIFR